MPTTPSRQTPNPRAVRHIAALCLVTTASLPSTTAQDIIGNDSQSKPKGAFPTLSILPEGSILRRVRLPRYDKDFKPTSLLAAEQLTVLDKNRIEGQGVTIELYERDGSLQARSKMRRAIYDQQQSTINAHEAVYLKGKNYVASGSGLTFHWQSKQGFLNGPSSTRFTYQKKDTTMNSPSPTSPRRQQLQMCAVMGTYLTISTSAMADAPAGLTPKDLSKLDQLSKPTAEQTTTDRLNTQKTIQEHTELSKKARAHITPFLNSIGKGTLLAQNPSATTTNTPPATPPTKPEATTPKLNEGESTLLVECDGGLYFDNETGILAYLKNIRLTEDRFKLTCRDELKVFLSQDEKKDDKADNKTDKPTNKKPEKEKEKENQLSSFGNLKQIIATGDVKVTRLDDQGKPFIAMSETASYEAKTGEIILRGGRPRLQQSANQYLQAQEPGQWIKVLKSGKLVTSSGKWKMVAILKNR